MKKFSLILMIKSILFFDNSYKSKLTHIFIKINKLQIIKKIR